MNNDSEIESLRIQLAETIMQQDSEWQNMKARMHEGEEVISTLLAALVASTSLLKRIHQDVAPSKKHALFSTKISDYEKAIAKGRAFKK